MTEAEWLDCKSSRTLLRKLSKVLRETGADAQASAVIRRQRLFGVACCRRFWNELTQRHRGGLQLMEQYADDGMKDTLKSAFAVLGDGKFPAQQPNLSTAGTVADEFRRAREVWLYYAVMTAVTDPPSMKGVVNFTASSARVIELEHMDHGFRTSGIARKKLMDHPSSPSELAVQCDILRDIFGNPFRPVAFSPAWRTEHTTGIAAKMYEDRDFAAMPILADALEEAGCGNADILSHCREPGVHVRGCWVVDLVLGKG